MSVFVNTKNEQEEKVLIAFLDSLNYKYQSDINDAPTEVEAAFLNQYNEEIDKADKEIESGNFISHEDVEQLFEKRRKLI
jgi:abortive infection bacteriophage resistance protein